MADKNREIWLIVRRALLMIVNVIERCYPAKDAEMESGDQVTVSYLGND